MTELFTLSVIRKDRVKLQPRRGSVGELVETGSFGVWCEVLFVGER